MIKKLVIVLFLKLLEISMCHCEEDPCVGETWTLSVPVPVAPRQRGFHYQPFRDYYNNIIDPEAAILHSIQTALAKDNMFNQRVKLEFFDLEGDLLANLDKHQSHMKEFPRKVTLFLNLDEFYNLKTLEEVLQRNYEYITLDDQSNVHEILTVTSIYNNVILVSNNVLKFPDLYAFIHDLKHQAVGYHSKGTKIAVNACPRPLTIYVDDENIAAANNIIKHSSSLKLRTAHDSDYEAIMQDGTTIAFLAKGPFLIPRSITVPTIFYDEHSYASPYSEKSYSFAHYFPWMPEEKALIALFNFLNRHEWKRVAVISDDSSVSTEFEQKLRGMLEKEDFIYTSRSCDVANCNYSEILAPVISQQAKIIIANIEYDETSDFANHVKQWTNVIWIFRSPTAAKHAHKQGIRNVLSVYKGNLESYYTSQNLLTVVKAVADYVNSRKELKPPTNNTERKALAEALKNYLYKKTEIDATIVRYLDNESPSVIATMVISPSNEVTNYKNNKKLDEISTEISGCTITSQVYMKPCYDTEYMFFMLVVSIFLLMILVIVYFFQSAEVSYTRFSN